MKKMILVADPSEHTRYRLSRMFQKEGHRVAVASDVEEAKATASVLAVDLLIADIDLPGVAGGDLLRFVRQQAGGRGLAALALAAKASPRAAEAAAAGFDSCLHKPINEAELRAAARQALSDPDGPPQKTAGARPAA